MTAKQDKPIELLPNPWKTFERATDVVAKSPPQHRLAKDKPKTKKASEEIEAQRQVKKICLASIFATHGVMHLLLSVTTL